VAVPSDQSELVLSQKVSETTLSTKAKNSIERRLSGVRWQFFTVEELAGAKVSYFNIRLPVMNEILDFLSKSSLRMNLNPLEIDSYRRLGHLPLISGETEVRALCLSYGSERALINLGIFQLQDMRRTSLEEISRAAGMGKIRLQEIEDAFRRLDFSIYRDKTERLCNERLQSM